MALKLPGGEDDGLKLVLADGSWVCYRLSGTEPVVRVYSEARSKEEPRKVERGSESMDLRLGPTPRVRILPVQGKVCAR
jgi:phosphomannomutase